MIIEQILQATTPYDPNKESCTSPTKLSVNPNKVFFEGPLGIGGFAKVFKGTLSGYPGDVAIKVVRTITLYILKNNSIRLILTMAL